MLVHGVENYEVELTDLGQLVRVGRELEAGCDSAVASP
jgi:hypothetical protein